MSVLPVVKAVIDEKRCIRDHRCLPEMHCPQAAITKAPDSNIMRINQDKCIGCGKCKKACKNDAIFLERWER